MQIKYRLGLLLTGLFIIFYGVMTYRKHGVFPYTSWQHLPVFPVGVVVVGFIIAAIAFMPRASWLDRVFTRKHQKPEARVMKFLHEHHRKGVSDR